MNGRAIDLGSQNGPKTRTTATPNRGPQHISEMPGLVLDANQAAAETVEKMVQPNERMSMIPGIELDQPVSGGRELVNISDIIPEEKNKEIPGVTMLESPHAEILKPGGIFDQYVKEKREEMIERMAQEDAKREIEAAEAEESSENTEMVNLEVDKDEEEILASQQVPTTMGQVTVNGVSREDDVSTSEPQKTEENHEVPYYQAMKDAGFQDDFQYPEEYGDLPTVEQEPINPENIDIEADIEKVEPEATREELKQIMDERAQAAQTEEQTSVEEKMYEDDVKDEVIESAEEDRLVHSQKVSFVGDSSKSIEELEKEIENESEGPTEDERLEELKAQITEKIAPKVKSLNLQGWTVANKATASNKILEIKDTSAGKWCLPATGICIQMREVSGQSIEKLRENMGNNATAARERLKIIYDHIITPKPQSFEAWTKSIAFADYDHLFMPMYLAAFNDSNYMPQTCQIEKGKIARKETGCGKMFLSDNMNIMKTVKFKDDESKKKFWDLYDSDRTNSEGLYASEIIPISNEFAIAFQEPTLYGVLLESATYGREFATKYSNVISFMPYIADIYWLDHANKKFVKVAYKEYANNAAKTAKSKAIRYHNIFETFNTDEYMNVVTIINAINENYDWMTYQIPEMTCPDCGRVIPAEEVSASGLVFTRHRLGILANTSIS